MTSAKDQSNTDPHSGVTEGRHRLTFRGINLHVVLAIGTLGVALRGVASAHNSLWLDEFHTLFHARAAGLGALLTGAASDNHPPLSFVLVHVSRTVFGEAPLALRAPSLVAGAVVLALLLVLAARLQLASQLHPARPTGGPSSGRTTATARVETARVGTAAWALLLAAVAPQAVMASSEARMYSLLGLCLVGLALAVERAERNGRLPIWTAPVLASALLAHYFVWHHLAVATLVVLLVPSARRSAARALANRGSITVIAGGLLLAAPWYAFGFVRQLEHGLWPGRGAATLRGLVDSLGGLTVRRLALAPDWLVIWLTLAAALVLVLAVQGWRTVHRSRPLTAGLLLAQVFVLPAWAALASHLFARSGFDPKYLSAAGLALVLLAGLGLASIPRAGWRGALGMLVTIPLLMQSSLIALNPGAEDYRGATLRALELTGPGVPFAPIEWQPDLFPRGQGFRYEADRLAMEHPDGEPEREWLMHDEFYGLQRAIEARNDDAPALTGLVVAVRGLPESDGLWSRLEARFGSGVVERFGSVRVVRYGVAAR